jgi:hypothetical protein
MIDDNDEDRPFCPSCHKAYSDHDGLIRTCHDLQMMRSKAEILHRELVKLVGTEEADKIALASTINACDFTNRKSAS